jgi:hypothetical protein
VFLSEQKLTVQVAQINGVKIDNVNLSEAGQDQILEQLTSDAASADEKNSCLGFPRRSANSVT